MPSLISGIALGMFLAAQPQIAAANAAPGLDGPRLVNIVHFIRGVEPRLEMDLLEPVVQQINLARKHHLPATFLIQFDALQQERFVRLLKEELPPDCEVGGWFEVVQPMVEAAGLPWRGRYPWDWHANVGFSTGYTPQEREKLVDVFMAEFQKVFGRLPQSVGSWFIDAHTLKYLADRYGVTASCNCKDQIGTDGYTLWGGYWNQAYYPSRYNALMPAQSLDQQIPIPVFRMLGSDPIDQYEAGLGQEAQSVVTLEPVYQGGGGNPAWVRWFFGSILDQPCLAFAYAQAGQENSFGWPAMQKGLIDQMALLEELRAAGRIRVETLAESAQWFRKNFPLTPATTMVAVKDSLNRDRASVWYNSRFYRANLYWDKGQMRIRDIHRFDERYPERYLTQKVTTPACRYDTLPIVDGFSWSAKDALAGIRPVWIGPEGARTPFTGGMPNVHSTTTDTVQADWPLDQGVLHCTLSPTDMAFTVDGVSPERTWGLELTWSPDQKTAITGIEENIVHYRYENFAYDLPLTGHVKSLENTLLFLPENNAIRLNPGTITPAP